MKNNKVICFDLDGTLVDSHDSIKSCLDSVLEKYGLELDEITKLKIFGPTLYDFFSSAFNSSDVDVNSLVADFETLYRQKFIRNVKLIDGAIDAIEALHGIGFEIAIVSSNNHENVLKICDETEISRVSVVALGVDESVRLFNKFDLIKKVLSLYPGHDIFGVVGDTASDQEVAKKIGARFYWASYGYGKADSLNEAPIPIKIKSPKEVVAVIQSYLSVS